MTYYPNSLDVAGAMRVQVGVGAEARGTDIRLARANTVRVRGKVSGAPQGAQVMVRADAERHGRLRAPGGRTTLVQQKDGSFDIRGVTPGSYVLSSIVSDLQAAIFTAQTIQVGEQHVEGVVLQLGAGGELPGTWWRKARIR